MKLADFFVKLGVVGDTKELDKTIKQMEKTTARTKEITKYRKELAKATTAEEKALVKKNFADKVRIENLKKEKAGLDANKAAFIGAVKGITGFIAAATVAYKVVDNMVNSLAKANQQLISFQRQTGISFASLNKYASANAAVNINSTVEGTAQSMQRVAQNLWDIRMGRGDISPYQELAYVGGKAFNPMGMSVEQVIESVRDAIKGVGDIQATNIITRMGFAPDDLMMLRMSREEFEKINSMFLNPQQREAINKYALELKQVQLQFNLIKDKALLKIMPLFIKLTKWLTDTTRVWAEFTNNIINAVKANSDLQFGLKGLGVILTGLLIRLHPVIAAFTALYLILEDIAFGLMGYDSITGDIINAIDPTGEKREQAATNRKTKKQLLGNHGFNMKDGGKVALEETPIGSYMLLFKLFQMQVEALKNKFESINPAQTGNNLTQYTPAIQANNTTNNTSNDNTWNVSIATNQPISNILNNLSNQYSFAQASYSGLTA